MFADICQRLDELPLGNELIYKLDTTIPDSFPYLADQFFMTGAEGWDFCLTEAEKRNIIRQAIQLKKLKGTIAGYRAIARIANARIPYYISPPAIPYLGARLTDEERLAFLSRYPTMRTYRFRTRGKKVGAMLWKCFPKSNSGYGTTYPTPQDKQYLVSTDARERFQERAFLRYPDGNETPLITYERSTTLQDGSSTTYLTARMPGIAYGLFLGTLHAINGVSLTEHTFAGRFSGKRFLVVHESAFKTFNVNFTTPYQYAKDGFIQTVQPSPHDPIDVHYQEVRQRSIRRGMFLGDIFSTAQIHPVTPVPLISPAISLAVGDGRVKQFTEASLTPTLEINTSIVRATQTATGESPTIEPKATLAKVRGIALLGDTPTLTMLDPDEGYVVQTNLDFASGVTPKLNPTIGIGGKSSISTRSGVTPTLNPATPTGSARAAETGLTPKLSPTIGIGRSATTETGATPTFTPTVGIGGKSASATRTCAAPTLSPSIGVGSKIASAPRSGTTPTLSPTIGIGADITTATKTGITPKLNPTIGAGTYSTASVRSGTAATLNPTVGVGTRTATASKSGATPTLNPAIGAGSKIATIQKTGATPTLSPAIGVGSKLTSRNLAFTDPENSQYLGVI
jgi:hypothetical protein